MAYFPYYKSNPDDFFAAMAGVPYEVVAAFALVEKLVMRHAGSLPDQARYIAGRLQCSGQKWRFLRQSLIKAGLLVVEHVDGDAYLWSPVTEPIAAEQRRIAARHAAGGRRDPVPGPMMRARPALDPIADETEPKKNNRLAASKKEEEKNNKESRPRYMAAMAEQHDEPDPVAHAEPGASYETEDDKPGAPATGQQWRDALRKQREGVPLDAETFEQRLARIDAKHRQADRDAIKAQERADAARKERLNHPNRPDTTVYYSGKD